MSADARFMALALSLGRRGLGQVWPNPAVGCVIVRDGRIVGRGWTQPGGRPHGEVVALAQAGEAARGATAYVTLEPCSHHGQTPPCADALAGAGVARVVVATGDPDPRVDGRGLARMRDAGIDVDTGLLAPQARADNAGFFKAREHGLPLVTLKLAASLDGRIATASGESRWITGPRARRQVHAMRMRHDAVMIGAGTARADDPMLDVRDMGAARQPVRVVVSRKLKLATTGRLAASARAQPLWLCHGPGLDPAVTGAWQALGARTFEIALRAGQPDMREVLKTLAREGLTRVLCEGGGALGASLLRDGLADRMVGFTAGLAIGAEGQPSLGALGLEALEDAPRFDLLESRAVGPDLMHVWQPRARDLA